MTLYETLDEISPINSLLHHTLERNLEKNHPYLKKNLGRLQNLFLQYATLKGKLPTNQTKKCTVICCADHGVSAEGISAYPQKTTVDMAANYLISKGGTANAMANFIRSDLYVLDVGIASPTDHISGLLRHKIAFGTKNIAQTSAMTKEEAIASIEIGIRFAEARLAEGYDCFLPGEMGIGNTTSAAAIAATICHLTPTEATGRGTNISDTRLRHKVEIVQQILDIHHPDSKDGLDVLMKIGGFEFGCIAGIILTAAKANALVILDGFNTAVAALIAATLSPHVKEYLIPAHMSAEPAHRATLRYLGLAPLLDLDLRLSETAGSSIVANFLDLAIALYQNDTADNVEGIVLMPHDQECAPFSNINPVPPLTLAPLDTSIKTTVQLHLDNLAKPIYSLGLLETLVTQLACVTENATPPLDSTCALLVLGAKASFPTLNRYFLSVAHHTHMSLSYLPIEKNFDSLQAYKTGYLHVKALATQTPILALAFSSSIPAHYLTAISNQFHKLESTNALFDNLPAFCQKLPPDLSASVAAFLGALTAAIEEKCLIVLDDSLSAHIASSLIHTTPSLKTHIYCPAAYLHTHVTFPCIHTALGLSILHASLHVLHDMKTFAEASVSVANDGPGATRQVAKS